ncbi:MAG: hypothetical protein LBH25_00840 [Fibromonadaceae bacterium]|jgi:uncharacterized protein (TIGR02145 family)|nr:hypothetical protein [Fibromonadaceae bacterium]
MVTIVKATAALLTILSVFAFAQEKGTFTDARDKKEYKTVKIGKQIWMAENLNYAAEGSVCYDKDQANCEKYGRLYNWKTAMDGKAGSDKEPSGVQGVCPKGWHLPSNKEWDKLYRTADSTSGTESLYESKTAGKYLKAKSGWENYKFKAWEDKDKVWKDTERSGGGEDTFGFSALPGGAYGGGSSGFGQSGGNNGFFQVGSYGYWWSSSERKGYYFYRRSMGLTNDQACTSFDGDGFLASVRCMKD